MFDFFKKKDQNEPQNSENKPEEKKGFFSLTFDNLKKTIEKTSESLVGNVVSRLQDEEEFDEFILDDMEELLIKADLGVNTASAIVDKLRSGQKLKPSQVKEYLKSEFSTILQNAGSNALSYKDGELNIYFIVGVNGAGKTTLIGKLAHRFKLQGKKVLVAAGDTFRAAAEEQLNIWSERAGAQIVRNDGADPASVVFDAIKKAKSENFDVVLVDTAGRLQNKFNLMQELQKVKSVIDKQAPEALRETILVLDANTGQNGLSQAKVFTECVNLTSVALTKLDGSAKGGIIIAIAREMNLPVKLIGVGEKMEDLKDFDAADYIEALFA
ncbi:TPA: signal recognition particle-docking protein FtsY [Candidatus Spyradomonas excrementavium]|nr:signal recognition particle-docking protein FtsY [Candidatus Spyradomonas excrementavium]